MWDLLFAGKDESTGGQPGTSRSGSGFVRLLPAPATMLERTTLLVSQRKLRLAKWTPADAVNPGVDLVNPHYRTSPSRHAVFSGGRMSNKPHWLQMVMLQSLLCHSGGWIMEEIADCQSAIMEIGCIPSTSIFFSIMLIRNKTVVDSSLQQNGRYRNRHLKRVFLKVNTMI